MMSESSRKYYRDKINADANESDNTTNNNNNEIFGM